MKNKKLLLLAGAAVLFLGVSSFGHFNQKITPVEAAAHADNYDSYTYSGHYYDYLDTSGSDGLQGDFRKALSPLILPRGWYTYGSSGEDHLSTQLQYADEDPDNSANMIYLYTRDSVKKNSAQTWNREHVWPQNNSNGHWGRSNAGTDLLHIRPTYNDTNNKRGNMIYADVNKQGPVTYNGIVYGYIASGKFEPIDSVKGDVARIIMYVWTAYYDFYKDSGLMITKTFESYDTLLSWHTMDEPDEMEGMRNDYCESSKQKNRNPFVDHPEYAWRVFGDSASSSVKSACMTKYPANGGGTVTPTKEIQSISISGTANKVNYYVGESFDPTGLTVTAHYNDQSQETIPLGNCSWDPNPLTEGITSVTCNYRKHSATYNGIAVTPRPVVQGEYSVDFVEHGTDSGDTLTAASIYSDCLENNNLIDSVGEFTKIFKGTNGLKLGSSKGTGSITFVLKEAARNNIVSLKLESSAFSNDQAKLEIKLDNTVVGSDIVPGEDFSVTLNKVSATNLTISTTEKRAYLINITLNIESNQPVGPGGDSSENPSSSSDYGEQSSGSGELSSDENSSSSRRKRSSKSSSTTGCDGSILGVSSLLGVGALIGLVFIFSKKK